LRRKLRFLIPLAVVTAVTMTLINYSSASENKGSASDTLVYAGSADPALLDPSLVSDGESIRVARQIFEGLVGAQLGGTKIVPRLATGWSVSKNRKVWTFTLRRNVKFSDGTPFNAAAVCFNFTRWYNFPGPLQNPSLSYYWNTVFLGFAKPAAGNPGPDKALYRGCKARGQYRVSLILSRPSSSFVAAIGTPMFGMASPTALKKYQADAGTVDATGVFHPTGSFATRNPVGTGPYKVQSWTVGNKLTLVRNPTYWGPKAKLARLIFVPIANASARLQAMQSGEVQAFDDVDPTQFGQITGKFRLYKRPPFTVGYIGINQSIPPMNNPLVRQALAYGINKGQVVKAFYGGSGAAATQFIPPSLFGNAKKGVPQYPYNPNKSRQLLQQAGLKLPVKVDFWYPTSVTRVYMPNPANNFQAFAADLDKAGFNVVAHSAPWRPDYRAGVQAGRDQLFLFGWIADFADPANFLNVHFGSETPQFGFKNQALFNMLARADAESDLDRRTALYEQASIQVMKFLPVIPYVWASGGIAFTSNVKGFIPSPTGVINEDLSKVSYG
jgi:peptide/nickel transport system substrate-binding protein